MPRAYISGAMSAHKDTDHNFPAFNDAARRWRAAGWEVCNPAEHFDGRTDLARHEYMRKDLAELVKCDAIVMLPGWQNSEGARLELDAAKECGLDTYFDAYNKPETALAVTLGKHIDPVDPPTKKITLDEFIAEEYPKEDRWTFSGIDGKGYKQAMDRADKPPLSLVPRSLIWALGRSLGHGAAKYAPHNFRKGMAWSQPYSGLLRHLTAWNDGEDIDADSGLSHLDCAAAMLSFLIEYVDHSDLYGHLDDRFKRPVAKS